jgi:phosphoribosylglycinamide formyltransferase-1
MNIAILISGSGTNLQAFIDAQRQGELDASIALVLSNRPGVAGLERAAAAGINCVVVDHKGFESREAFDQALVDTLAAQQIDLVVLAGFMRILTPVFIDCYQGRLLNIHPSLLPLYPGLHTHRRALEAGDSQTGATVHFVTRELDGGPPIIQARVPIVPGDNPDTLAARVLQWEHRIYPLAVNWFTSGRLRLRENQAMLDNAALPTTGFDYQG